MVSEHFCVFLLLVHFAICDETSWDAFENEYKDHNREVIHVTNVSIDTPLHLNASVKQWKSLNLGHISLVGGVSNNGTLLTILIFNNLLNDDPKISEKQYNLEYSVSEIEFYSQWKHGEQRIYVVAYYETMLIWYLFYEQEKLEKKWIWSIETPITSFNFFKHFDDNYILINTEKSILIYGFDIFTQKRWYDHTILLSYPSKSSCLSFFNNYLYLAITQQDYLKIYKLSENHKFLYSTTLNSSNITQVICFENGFKSFIAFNGQQPAIYELTTDGPSLKKIHNSNLDGVEYWLPVATYNYRDETILFLQKKIDYGTHMSFDFDIVTYNGRNFEEHEDIPCKLFGEEYHGLISCLRELNNISGILGSACVSYEDRLTLVVPHLNRPSTIVVLEIDISKIENPVETKLVDFQLKRESLQAIIDDQYTQLKDLQEKIHQITENQTKLKMRAFKTQDNESDRRASKIIDNVAILARDFEELKPRLQKKKYTAFIFNGPVEIKGNLKVDAIKSDLIKLNEFVRKDKPQFIYGEKIFKNLTTHKLTVETVNGTSAEEFVTSYSPEIVGNIVFNAPVTIHNANSRENTVNNRNIFQWIKVSNNTQVPGTLHFDSLEINSHQFVNNLDIKGQLLIPNNVTVNTINGNNFEEFLKKFCLLKVQCHIPKLKLQGFMNVTSHMKLNTLNDLKYPEEFVNVNEMEPATFTGIKYFTKSLRTLELSLNGNLNEKNLNEVVTLSTEQVINGNQAFNRLETEISNLKVHGDFKQNGIIFEENSPIYEAQSINANIEFYNLEVQGNVIVKHFVNNTNITTFFNDYLLKSDENITITALKNFPNGITIKDNLHVISNKINEIKLESFITKDTSQDLHINAINGNVNFDNLMVKGLINGYNISKLNDTLVRIDRPETFNNTITFIEPVKDLAAQELAINAENILMSVVDMDKVTVKGNLNGEISSLNLMKNMMNYINDQTIQQPYIVGALKCNHIEIENINGLPVNKVFSMQSFHDNITDILTYRNATVKDMHTEGHLNLRTVNQVNFQKLLNEHPWSRLYRNGSNLTIDGDVYFETLNINNLSKDSFDDFFDRIIFKSNVDVTILDSLKLLEEVVVNRLIETSTLNGVSIDNILRFSGTQRIKSPINFESNVTLDSDVDIIGLINNVDAHFLKNNFEYQQGSLKVKGTDLLFNEVSYIQNMTVNGLTNAKDLKSIENKLIFVNEDAYLKKSIIFNEKVYVHGNLDILHDINEVKLSELFSKVVYTNQNTEIVGPIQLSNYAEFTDIVNVYEEIITKHLMDHSLEEELSKGVFLGSEPTDFDGHFHFENLTINNDLKFDFINEVIRSGIVTLKTSQNLPGSFFIKNMSVNKDLHVGNTVNKVNLIMEKNKTLLRDVEQTVSGELVFLNNVLVQDKIKVQTLNKKPVTKLVTTNTDQNLTASYHFNGKIFIAKDLTINGLVNDKNFTSWTVPYKSQRQRNINEIMPVENLNLIGPINGDLILNEVNTTKLLKELLNKQQNLASLRKGILGDIQGLCKDLIYLHETSKRQYILKFNYFEEFRTLEFDDPVKVVKFLKFEDRYYLLVHPVNSCTSELLQIRADGIFESKTISIGTISQIEAVYQKDLDKPVLFLITRSSNASDICTYGTTVWKFKDENLTIVNSLENQQLLQDSSIASTFYGYKSGKVIEFKVDPLNEIEVQEFRRWDINEENAYFVPRGLKTGLSMANGEDLIFLNTDFNEQAEGFDIDTSSVIIGNFSRIKNSIFPKESGGDMAVINVGFGNKKKALLAIARHKDTQVEHRMDFVEIYADSLKGELFDRILSYRPSSLLSIEFKNGESLLAFMEDNKVLQIFEYKGIEGFKHRSTIHIQAEKLFLMDLPMAKGEKQTEKVLGLVHKNRITLLQTIMLGKEVEDKPEC
ncbi:hypothetical protein ABEB36_013879 [Hypothenemus hampei]|uniref:Uncharacterized protein n=1 Tax=Hypothenemus hampei TaxID=57062 RepID=A0ABD1EA25_HYPHA